MGPVKKSIGQRLREIVPAGRNAIFETLKDGQVNAGNLAYLSLVTLLPFAILITAVAGALGRTGAGQGVIAGLLGSLPDDLENLFTPIVQQVVEARSGHLLWIGGIVALWTVSGFVVTLRSVVHHAYEYEDDETFVKVRLKTMASTLGTMVLVVLSFLIQLIFVVLMKSFVRFFPYAHQLLGLADLSRIFSFVLVFMAVWAIFKLLTPRKFRAGASWPGALVTTIVWTGSALLLGPILQRFSNMDLTYGALSGVMVAMLFFYVVGFTLVYGAELNAELAKRDNSSYQKLKSTE